MEREIQFVTVAGRDIPAYQVICPVCKAIDLDNAPGEPCRGVLDLNTTFDTAAEPWIARCSQGHEWKIEFSMPA